MKNDKEIFNEVETKAMERLEKIRELGIAEMVTECIDIIDTINFELLDYNEYQNMNSEATLPLDGILDELVEKEAKEKYNSLSEEEQEETNEREIADEIYEKCNSNQELAERYFANDKQGLYNEIEYEVSCCLGYFEEKLPLLE